MRGNFASHQHIAPVIDGLLVAIHTMVDDVGARDVAAGVNGTPLGAQKLQGLGTRFQHIAIVVHLHYVAHFIQIQL